MENFKTITVGGTNNNESIRSLGKSFCADDHLDSYMTRIRRHYNEIKLSENESTVDLVVVTFDELHLLNNISAQQDKNEWHDISVANHLAKLVGLDLLSSEMAANIHTQTTLDELIKLKYSFVVCGMDRVMNDFMNSTRGVTGSVLRFKGHKAGYYPADNVVRFAKNEYGCLLYAKPR